MMQNKKPVHDPWRELVRTKETNQVELDEVLSRLSVDERNVQALKKALIARVDHLIRTR